ncbi:maleylpyruvate isomerase family mycothiol-dependent enzyme [Nocardioides panacisoli]|uniref:Maleylpyruvate isomerase family mycothiol-dependent enzyme n=1 Tax=Nocardioides panacisoli TaxID=627624 RepID=A0ABP7J128_9ACTN
MTSAIDAATARLLETADRLPDPDWSAPSLCTGWSRAHVLGHVALNAEGFGGAVLALADGRPATAYRSAEGRTADIEALALEPPEAIRERLRTSAALFADALARLADLEPGATFERTPGGTVIPAAAVPGLRLREVEIHHADLETGYTHGDWPAETVLELLDNDAPRYVSGPGFVAQASDLGREWAFGSPAPGAVTVTGPASALAWWATGRDPGDVLSCSEGELPRMEGR